MILIMWYLIWFLMCILLGYLLGHWLLGLDIKSKKIIEAGQAMPGWYGVAYLIDGNATKICFLIPLNLLVAAARKIRHRLRYAKQNRWDEDLQAAHIAGHREGQKTGFEAGQNTVPGLMKQAYSRGFEAGKGMGYAMGFESGQEEGRKKMHNIFTGK